MKLTFVTALASGALLAAACGDNGKDTPDAPVHTIDAADIDAMPDAGRTCTSVATTGAFGFQSGTMFSSWEAPITDLGDGGPSSVRFEFYGGIEDMLTGSFDLTTGAQNNYSTCALCVRAFSFDENGDVAHQWFQDGGSINLTADPVDTQHLAGTGTNISLVEVTIDPSSFISTPVVGGTCLTLGPTVPLTADNVPAEWTCDHAAFGDGATCDCACGTDDPDCDIAGAPVAGCTGAQICDAAVCTDGCNVLGGMGCPMAGEFCGFETATQDICYTNPAGLDAAALGAACTTTATFCGLTGTIATGICDSFQADDGVCHKACAANSDCLATEVCGPIVGTKGVCVPKSANDTCQTAIAIATPLTATGTPINGSTAGSHSNYNAGLDTSTCTDFPQPGQDVVYSVALTAGQVITAKLENVSPDLDPSLSLLGPGTPAAVCDPATVTCNVGADANGTGDGESLTFTATTAGTYYLIVDSFYTNAGGSFTLTVTSP